MLVKENRLKNKKDFDIVFREGKGYKGDFLFLKVKNNNLGFSRFGIVVGKKVSNKAVIRNKIKRRLREILRKKTDRIKKGVDIILITLPGIEKQGFKDLENEVEKVLKKAEII
ncbi:ribonuclease P protein component [Candidatus Parcubacteria bacterium]|nr:ribonuclease P protein component [Candidatus Parcubacteria bacterium]